MQRPPKQWPCLVGLFQEDHSTGLPSAPNRLAGGKVGPELSTNSAGWDIKKGEPWPVESPEVGILEEDSLTSVSFWKQSKEPGKNQGQCYLRGLRSRKLQHQAIPIKIWGPGESKPNLEV